jgi:hypothetical protein
MSVIPSPQNPVAGRPDVADHLGPSAALRVAAVLWSIAACVPGHEEPPHRPDAVVPDDAFLGVVIEDDVVLDACGVVAIA